MTGLGITSDCYFSPSSLKISATDQNQIINSLKQCEIHWEKGETVEFALSQLLIHWGFWVCRGFDSLHPLHFSTLHSERFTDAIDQWRFWFSQRIQWASSEIWRSNSVLWSLCFCINWWICCCCRCLRRFISLDCFVLSNLRLSLMSMLLLRSRST